MKLEKQRNEYLLGYLKRAYDSYLREAVRAEMGVEEYEKNIPLVLEKCGEYTDMMLETSEHHIEEIMGEVNEAKAV